MTYARKRITLVTLGLIVAILAVFAVATNPASGLSFSKGGTSWSGTATCPSNGTTVHKTSSSGGNPGYAARFRESSTSSWRQGPTVNSGTSSVFGATAHSPQHGIRIFWGSGAQNYTFC